jgi:DNA-binding response OmpR family regulator
MARKHRAETILIIEDEADVRTFASRVLELEGYRILQAENGDTGLGLMRETQVALVLLDLRLPERNGWAVLAELKSDAALSAIPVIMFTASAAAAQRDRALNAGAADYLTKPLSAASLKTAVANVLRHKR